MSRQTLALHLGRIFLELSAFAHDVTYHARPYTGTADVRPPWWKPRLKVFRCTGPDGPVEKAWNIWLYTSRGAYCHFLRIRSPGEASVWKVYRGY